MCMVVACARVTSRNARGRAEQKRAIHVIVARSMFIFFYFSEWLFIIIFFISICAPYSFLLFICIYVSKFYTSDQFITLWIQNKREEKKKI